MDTFSSYQGVTMDNFDQLSQSIASNIQKISQNGNYLHTLPYLQCFPFFVLHKCTMLLVYSSVCYVQDGQPVADSTRLAGAAESTVSLCIYIFEITKHVVEVSIVSISTSGAPWD